jgi:hypothetical protein
MAEEPKKDDKGKDGQQAGAVTEKGKEFKGGGVEGRKEFVTGHDVMRRERELAKAKAKK